MARQLIKAGDNDRLINAKVAANLAEIGMLPVRHSERPDFVRSPRAAATILDALLAGVSGPKFVGAARNFRSFARDANARFEAVYAALGPFASADFDNVAYSINGAAKTLAELWPDLGILVLTDDGLECAYAGGTGSASQTVFGSGELFDAVDPAVNNTVIYDVDLIHDPLDEDNFETRLSLYLGDYDSYSIGLDVNMSTGLNRVQSAFSGNEHTNLFDVLVNGLNRIAVNFGETSSSFSVNGSDVVTFVPTGQNFSSLTQVYLFFVAQSAAHRSISRLRKIRWLPLKSDLSALSAL